MKPYETKEQVSDMYNTFQGKLRIKTLVKYFHGKLFGEVLYVGQSDQLGQHISFDNDIKIYCTDFDLDVYTGTPNEFYDIIIIEDRFQQLKKYT